MVSSRQSNGAVQKGGSIFFGMRPSRRKIMACFTIPLAEGIILSVAKKIAFKKDAESALKARLGHLENMLYGGSFLLAIEHIYHGEVVLYPPFLTAMRNPEDIPEMLHEMATVGVSMAAIVTLAWAGFEIVSHLAKRTGIKQNLSGAL